MKTIVALLLAVSFLVSCSKELADGTSDKDKSIKEAGLTGAKIKTQVILLGTGTPNADPERSGPAVAIIVGENAYLVDCGPGIVRRAGKAFKKGIKQLAIKNLDKLFITHLHSDHTAGYPDLILSPWTLGREKPLKVWGPKGTSRMTSHILEAYSEDINNRLNGIEPANKTGYMVNVTEFSEGLVYQDSNVSVYAYKVEHAGWKESYAFQFITPDRVITISGDCKPCEGIIAASMGCDILVHEAYSYIGRLTRKPEWQKYHKNAHTSTKELSELANTVKPKKVVMYHILSWGAKPEVMVNEVKQSYKGKVICGEDLGVY